MPPVPPGNYVLAATAIWTASVASAEGLQPLKSLKLYILHGQLLESDAPLAGGLWNALQGLVLLWKALSVSGLLFWRRPGPGAWALGCPARQNPITLSAVRQNPDTLSSEPESRHTIQ